MADNNALLGAPAALVVIIACAALVLVVRRLQSRPRSDLQAVWNQVGSLAKVETLDAWAEAVLQIVSNYVDARELRLYMRDSRNEQVLVLRGRRVSEAVIGAPAAYQSIPGQMPAVFRTGFIDIEPENPSVRLSIPVATEPRTTSLYTEGREQFICVPLVKKDGQLIGSIHAGPLRRSGHTTSIVKNLESLREPLSIAAALIDERERAYRQAADLAYEVRGAALAASSAMNPSVSLERVVRVAARTLGAKAWILIIFGDHGGSDHSWFSAGIQQALAQQIASAESVRSLGLPEHGPLTAVIDFGRLPDGLLRTLARETRATHLAIMRLAGHEKPAGLLAFALEASGGLPESVLSRISEVSGITYEVVKSISRGASPSSVYLETLRSIVSILDLQDAYTTGQSARVAKYAHEIATQIGLPKAVASSIQMAAYLRDIGMAEADRKGMLKEVKGSYSKAQRNLMEAHARLGAAMIQPIDPSGTIAPLILHHHERFDGYGYPEGLRGEEIPLGARIIAVSDTFSAMTSPRVYRSQMRFREAIETIKTAAGMQFDPHVVGAFLRIWDNKRKAAGNTGLPLEPCWEMNQCPISVRLSCPAGHGHMNCWEITGTLCHLHGCKHSTCIVFTEYADRLDSYSGYSLSRAENLDLGSRKVIPNGWHAQSPYGLTDLTASKIDRTVLED